MMCKFNIPMSFKPEASGKQREGYELCYLYSAEPPCASNRRLRILPGFPRDLRMRLKVLKVPAGQFSHATGA